MPYYQSDDRELGECKLLSLELGSIFTELFIQKEDMDYKLSYWQIENESSRHTDMEEKIKTGTEDG